MHHSWSGQAKAAFPQALLLGPPAVAAKRGDLDTTIASPEDLPPSWPRDQLEVRPIRGFALDELALLHKPSRSLVLTDAAFNFHRGGDAELWKWYTMPWALAAYLWLTNGYRRCCVSAYGLSSIQL